MILRLIKWAHDLIAKANVPLTALALMGIGLVAFEGMVYYNQRSDFCLSCHVNRGPYKNIDLKSVAHEPYVQGESGCLDCHSDKDFHAFALQTAKNAGKFLTRFTNDYQYASFEVDDVPDADCLGCHNKALDEKDAAKIDLSPGLAKIGLRFDHQYHFEMKEFTPQLQNRLGVLLGQNDLSEQEMVERDRLEKIRLGNCAQCHQRDKIEDALTGERKTDRQINFYARNPIMCSGCHVDAVTSVHPGPPLAPPLALPDEMSCRRCHNGRLHGRIVTFPAMCDSTQAPFTDYCNKCHPDITPGIHKTGDLENAGQMVLK